MSIAVGRSPSGGEGANLLSERKASNKRSNENIKPGDNPGIRQSIRSSIFVDDVSSKPKPWEDNRKNLRVGRMSTPKIRTRLPGIEAYDHEVEFRVNAAPRVVLRMERVLGTDRFRLNDPKYMLMLSKRIEEEENRIWLRRDRRRQLKEHARHRQLIIDGVLDPTEGMETLRNNPIFRVNQMMHRINKIHLVSFTGVELPTNPIEPTEPFEDQKRTGYLFEWHTDHYKKHEITTQDSKSDPSQPSMDGYDLNLVYPPSSMILQEFTPRSSQMDFESVSEEFGQQTIKSSRPALSATVPSQPSDSKVESKTSLIPPRIDSVNFPGNFSESDLTDLPTLSPGKEEFSSSIRDKVNFAAELLRRESLSQARRYFGLDEDDLKKRYEAPPHSLITQLLDEDITGKSIDLFTYTTNLTKVFWRGQDKTDEFIVKVHNKAFPHY